jgi:hypothetical protein
MIADLLCGITGETTELITIPSSSDLIIYEYSGWHNTLLIDYNQSRKTARSQFLRFSTQCNLIAYRGECIIEVIITDDTTTEDEHKSTLFIIIHHIIIFISIPIYLTVGFLALFVTFKK